jgi:hypothetical protein
MFKHILFTKKLDTLQKATYAIKLFSPQGWLRTEYMDRSPNSQ